MCKPALGKHPCDSDLVGKRRAPNKGPHLGCTLVEWDDGGEEGEEDGPARADKD